MLVLNLAKTLSKPKGPVLETFRRFTKKGEMSVKEYYQMKVGNREQVGYGQNGDPCYIDRADLPFPSIRYMENTAEILALRHKERGDWKKLSMDEKKTLYRASFCQTFSELHAPTGEWKSIVAWTAIYVCGTIWLYFIWAHFLYKDQLPVTFKPEYQMAQQRRIIDSHQEPILGTSSNWDYEKKEWKDVFWFKKPNPFKDECGDYIEEVPYDM